MNEARSLFRIAAILVVNNNKTALTYLLTQIKLYKDNKYKSHLIIIKHPEA